MTNNEAITNIEIMANKVMSFRSCYHTDKDVYAEVDDAAQEAENALHKLAKKMRYYDPDAHDMKKNFNAHNPSFIQVETKGNDDCEECYFANKCDFVGCRLAGGYHYELTTK